MKVAQRLGSYGAFVIVLVLACLGSSSASAAMISINPSKDNTLYQYVAADGDLSNGKGDHFFAGETDDGLLRRGVLAFDIAGHIPPGSTITGVSLSLSMSRTSSDTSRTVELHSLLADWGEGTSQAQGEEGMGAPAATNDATWRHRFYDTIFWTTQGGDFSATVSGSQSVGPLGQYTWSSTQMIADVQSWLDNPANNFGWLVLGDESTSRTTKRFDTRESASPPVLTIVYTEPTPSPTPTASPTPTVTATATATSTPTATFTPTSTASLTPTSTPTPTPTLTPCVGRCGPTPRPRPTSAGRPTPPPRLTPPPTPTGSPRPTPAPRPS